MGIDVYLNWKGQTDAEAKAQLTGYRIDAGNVGYLREAYHGGPYATQVLMPEGWNDELREQYEGEIPIPAATLRERLPATIITAMFRHHIVYEGERKAGEPGVLPDDAVKRNGNGDAKLDPEELMKDPAFRDVMKNMLRETQDRTAMTITKYYGEEHINSVKTVIESRQLPDFALSFVDFVELAERKERETGEPCTVHVSA